VVFDPAIWIAEAVWRIARRGIGRIRLGRGLVGRSGRYCGGMDGMAKGD